jgi:hypothetical protein
MCPAALLQAITFASVAHHNAYRSRRPKYRVGRPEALAPLGARMSDYRQLRIHFPAGSPFYARRYVTNNFVHAAFGSRISAVGKIF